MKLRTKAPDGLNSPSRWHHYMKPWFDVVGYQHRINQRVGLNKDGKPIIRLVWGQDEWAHAFGKDVPRYWTRRQKAGEGYRYWRVPRWILEKRIEPEQYAEAWERTRWAMTDETGTPVDKGPAPEEYYLFAYLCAEHDGLHVNGQPVCCDIAFHTDRTRCWGRYRAPADFDLELIAQAVRAMEADKFRDPYRPLTVQELAEAEMAANMQVERAQQEFEEYEAQMMRDAIRLHGHRIFEGPNSFHDMHTESGLYIPE